jgi:hypothetical protein
MAFNNDIAIREQQVYQEYQIALTTSAASSAVQLAFPTNAQSTRDDRQILILEARGDNIVFNFGTSSVVASKTLTNSALPAGNFSVPQGAIFSVAVNGKTQNYVSAIAESSGSSSTFAIVRLATMNL